MGSIRNKLTMGLVLAVVAISLIAGGVLMTVVQHRLIKDFESALESETRAVAGMISWDPKGFAEMNLAEQGSREFSPGRHADYFEVWGDDGKVIVRSHSLGNADLAVPTGTVERVTLPDGRAGRSSAIAFMPNLEVDEIRGAVVPPRRVTLVIARGTEDVRRTLAVIGGGLAAAAAVMIIGGVAAVRFLVIQGLKPLHNLGEQLAGIDARDLSTRVDGDSPVELQPIIGRMNELLSRLDAAFQREHRFTAAAAHELRTPIAELRTLADFSLLWPETSTAKMHDVRAIATEMEALSAALLTLSRCESGRETAASDVVDLAAAIQRAWDAFVARAQERSLRLNLSAADPRVLGDAVMIDAIARNLIDNAFDYSPPGSTIDCCIVNGVLRITNPQRGLEPHDLVHLFEPFWRKMRQRDSRHSHRGLGLSLVGSYVNIMGAKAHAQLTEHGNFEIAVTFRRIEVREPYASDNHPAHVLHPVT